ncbi:hypothetical protein M433DRAFT_142458 [Acidomyces richmondensis BFW]|nr:MAG: hypothetical protein FE78DRAFT_76648 [Acidomyces sp. 'richmondensis']KYG46965.1 hypothetical protein M433DRAFT_142458 [Acidomyces richmondensis BFW]
MNSPYGSFDIGGWDENPFDALPLDGEDWPFLSYNSNERRSSLPAGSHIGSIQLPTLPRKYHRDGQEDGLAVYHIETSNHPQLFSDPTSYSNAQRVDFVGGSALSVTSDSEAYTPSISPANLLSAQHNGLRYISAIPILFPPLPSERSGPPPVETNTQQLLKTQDSRFDGDLYTANWVRGDGANREGWCCYCSEWYQLRDSAYWYHTHFKHGISRLTGRQYLPPERLRRSQNPTELALCPECAQWITVGNETRCRTAYYRHSYKCSLRHRNRFPRQKFAAKSTQAMSRRL